MRFLISGLTLALIHAAVSTLPADEALPSLPKDGAWVQYVGTTKQEGLTDESTFRRTYSLVGTKTENERLCRWVEVKDVVEIDQGKRTHIAKFLIPERELLENEKPLESLVRGWRKSTFGDVQEMKFNTQEGFFGSAHFVFGANLLIFPGPQKLSREIREPKSVDYQSGRLEIPSGRNGQFRADYEDPVSESGRVRKRSADFSVWSHPEIPLGAAEWKLRLEIRNDDRVISVTLSEFVLEDFGTDAKSTLPDHD